MTRLAESARALLNPPAGGRAPAARSHNVLTG